VGDVETPVANLTVSGSSSNMTLVPNGNIVFGGSGANRTVTITPAADQTGTTTITVTVTDEGGLTAMDTFLLTVTTETPPIAVIYVSSTSSGTAGGISFKDEDILAYDLGTGVWSMYFDGSDVGLDASGTDISAFHINPDDSILLSLLAATTIPDVGSIDDSDIVRFTPTSTGTNTAGTYQWYFDGSDVGLLDKSEDIHAMGFLPDGRLAISTNGSFSVSGVSGKDEDLIVFTDTSLGETTSGSWELYFDGSDVGLDTDSGEDVVGTWIDINDDIYLTTRGLFSVAGAVGDSADIFTCVPGSTGVDTSCTFSLFWDGSANGFGGEIIDGFFLQR